MPTGGLVCFPQSKPHLEEVDLYFPLPGNHNLSIALLSDLHIRNSTNLGLIFSMVDGLAPSLLFLLGDYFLTYKKSKVEEFFHLLSQINPPLGKYAVLGNRDANEFLPYLFERAGTILLRNEYVNPKEGSLNLVISGVDYGITNIHSLLNSLPSANLSILLSHTPDIIFSPGNWRKVDLVVSGHTHGGQIRIPFLGAIFTKSRLPRRYASGLSRLPGLYLYVSRGVGVTKIPLRFACPSEITLLRIRKGSEANSEVSS